MKSLLLLGELPRWYMLLFEYDIEYCTQKAIKSSVLADYLAHQPVEYHQSAEYEVPDEEVIVLKVRDCEEPFPKEGPDPESRWSIVFDGAMNAYGKGIGVVIVTPHGSPKIFLLNFPMQFYADSS